MIVHSCASFDSIFTENNFTEIKESLKCLNCRQLFIKIAPNKIDSFLDSFHSNALKLLTLLAHVCPLFPLFYKRLDILLTMHDNPDLIKETISCQLALLNLHSLDSSLRANELMNLYIHGLIMSSTSKNIFLSAVTDLLPDLHSDSILYLNQLVILSTDSLSTYPIPCIKLLKSLIKYCWPRIQYHSKFILNRVLACWYQFHLNGNKNHDDEFKEFINELSVFCNRDYLLKCKTARNGVFRRVIL